MTATFAQVVSVEAKPVDVPEKMAEYPGGISALMNFLQRTLKLQEAFSKARSLT